uniref:Uncharacterized protein n=1 Tax=Oryza brachyantha TaxID=4533 RepID=J3MI87_ORYBR
MDSAVSAPKPPGDADLRASRILLQLRILPANSDDDQASIRLVGDGRKKPSLADQSGGDQQRKIEF